MIWKSTSPVRLACFSCSWGLSVTSVMMPLAILLEYITKYQSPIYVIPRYPRSNVFSRAPIAFCLEAMAFFKSSHTEGSEARAEALATVPIGSAGHFAFHHSRSATWSMSVTMGMQLRNQV